MSYDSDGSDLTTYNPYCVEQYTDSSDFDDSCSHGGHTIIKTKFLRKRLSMEYVKRNMFYARSNERNYRNNRLKSQYLWNNGTVKDHYCTATENVVPENGKHSSICEKKIKYYERNHNCNNRHIQLTQSKLAILRNKVMPCLSNIFCHSPAKRVERVKENHVIDNCTKDNGCQVYSINYIQKRRRKFNKRGRDYIVQPTYTDEDVEHTPPLLEPPQHVPLLQDICAKVSSESCLSTSSSLSLQTAKNEFRTVVERELKKYYLKKQNIRRNKEQQYPSMINFQISSNQQTLTDIRRKKLQNDCDSNCGVMPSNSSVLWEYLVDRISRKYQNNNRGGVLNTCHCTNLQQCPSMPKSQESSSQNSQGCSCKPSLIMDKPLNMMDQKHQPAAAKAIGANKVICHCGPGSPQKPQQPPLAPMRYAPAPLRMCPGGRGGGVHPPLSPTNEMMRPCQEPHDQVKTSLQQKYNGEILCIHNPPCILINGCLNLPPVKGQFVPTATAWPVTQQTSYHTIPDQTRNNAITDWASQCQQPNQEYFLYNVIDEKKEKMTQSICNHVPPCKVVRSCYKRNFDLKRARSCTHVPTCHKVPECLICNSELTVCDHQPTCLEMSVCKERSNKFLVMTAKENVETQMKPMKLECRHQPPCIMIPRCLGKLMCGGYVPYEAIPSCPHQPTCDLIPACCRKSAKMVSVYCQYPTLCRIV